MSRRAAVPAWTRLSRRFWSKVDRTGDCWVWTAFRYRGYGRLKVRTERRGPGATVPATHVAWELVNGPIPEGMCVLHRCDNPPCVRPDHLFLGTRRDNVLDMAAKGRATFGERSGTAKLTASAVADIRARYGAGETQRPLAREYGVSQSTVSLVVNRHRWAA